MFKKLILISLLMLTGHMHVISALQWEVEDADNAGAVGIHTSIALDSSGLPHISYYDVDDEYLKYAYKDSQGWHTTVVDTAGYRVGWFSSIALDPAGLPRISYFGVVDLRYAFLDGDGWHIQTVQTDAYMGGYTSLALDNDGFPHIAYYWSTSPWDGDLRYAYMDDAGWQLELVDSEHNKGKWASLKLDDDDCAHVSYCDYHESSWYSYPIDLRYAYRGTEGWSIEIADGGGNVGAHTSLDLDEGGFPHISYLEQVFIYSNLPTQLKYAYKDTEGWHAQTVDRESGAGTYTSLALDNAGSPRISYWERVRGDLKFASLLGTVWYREHVDVSGTVGSFSSLALDPYGFPQISYYDQSNTNLKYACGEGISLAARVEGDALALYWSPYPWASSFRCHGEENHTYFEPGVGNLLIEFPPEIATWSVSNGIGDPASEWTFVIIAVDDSAAELVRSNYSGEREFVYDVIRR